jgi:hypothetical protein
MPRLASLQCYLRTSRNLEKIFRWAFGRHVRAGLETGAPIARSAAFQGGALARALHLLQGCRASSVPREWQGNEVIPLPFILHSPATIFNPPSSLVAAPPRLCGLALNKRNLFADPLYYFEKSRASTRSAQRAVSCNGLGAGSRCPFCFHVS